MKWDIEKAAEYERNIHDAITFTEMRGKPLTIEYVDDNLNVISTLKIKGDEKKFLDSSIKLVYQNFQHPIYKQKYGDFVPSYMFGTKIYIVTNIKYVNYIFNVKII